MFAVFSAQPPVIAWPGSALLSTMRSNPSGHRFGMGTEIILPRQILPGLTQKEVAVLPDWRYVLATSYFFQDFITEPEAKPWRKAALSRGYRASIAIPLKDNDGSVFAVLSLYSHEPNSFNPDEIRLLEELARDISFGVIALRDKAKRHQAELELADLASFPELNPNPIVELEANGKIVYVNHAAKYIFPYLTTNSLKRPFLVGWENLIKTIKNQDDQSITREINVGQHWYLQNVIYVPTTDHYHIYGRNITERKKIEYTLLKNEKKFRLLNEINSLLLTERSNRKRLFRLWRIK